MNLRNVTCEMLSGGSYNGEQTCDLPATGIDTFTTLVVAVVLAAIGIIGVAISEWRKGA